MNDRYEVSEKYINECKTKHNGTYGTKSGRIYVIDDNVDINGEGYDGNLLSFTIKDNCYENDSIIGTTVSKEITVELMDSNTFNLENKEIQPYMSVDDEEVPFGTFIISKSDNEEVSAKTSFTGYDYMIKFNVTYEDNNIYPISLYNFLKNVCNQAGVELGSKSIVNGNYKIQGNPFTNNETCRQIVSEICQLCGGFAKIGRDDKLYIKNVNVNQSNIETIDGYVYNDFTKNNQYGEVNRLVLSLSEDITGEHNTIQDVESIEKNGLTQIVISANSFLTQAEERLAVIDNIWDVVHGFQYIPFTIDDYYGFPYLDSGDKVIVLDDDDNEHETYIFNHTITYNGVFSGSIETGALTETQQTYSTETSAKSKIRNVELSVDKINGQITSIIEEQDEFSSGLSSVIQTVDELSQKISSVQEFVRELTGINELHIEDIAEGLGYVISLIIYGNTDLFNTNEITIVASTKPRGYGENITLDTEDGDPIMTEGGKGTTTISDTLSASDDGIITVTRYIGDYYVTPTGNYNIRSEPTESSSIVKAIAGGTYVYVFDTTYESSTGLTWCRIGEGQYLKQEALIAGTGLLDEPVTEQVINTLNTLTVNGKTYHDTVETTDDGIITETRVIGDYYVTPTGNYNIRSEPTESSSIVKAIAGGTYVYVFDTTYESSTGLTWCRIGEGQYLKQEALIAGLGLLDEEVVRVTKVTLNSITIEGDENPAESEELIIGSNSYYIDYIKLVLDGVLNSLTIDDTTYYDTLEIAQDGTITQTRRIGDYYANTSTDIYNLSDEGTPDEGTPDEGTGEKYVYLVRNIDAYLAFVDERLVTVDHILTEEEIFEYDCEPETRSFYSYTDSSKTEIGLLVFLHSSLTGSGVASYTNNLYFVDSNGNNIAKFTTPVEVKAVNAILQKEQARELYNVDFEGYEYSYCNILSITAGYEITFYYEKINNEEKSTAIAIEPEVVGRLTEGTYVFVYETCNAIYEGTGTNIYSSNTTTSDKVGYLNTGTYIYVYEIGSTSSSGNTWYRIGENQWISSSKVTQLGSDWARIGVNEWVKMSYLTKGYGLLGPEIVTVLDETWVIPSVEEVYYFIEELYGINYYIKYITKSDFSDYYATKAELNSAITLTANSILSTVSLDLDSLDNTIQASLELKVNTEDLISEINASADVITLTSGRLIINSGNFQLDSSGNITCTSGKIGGFTIGSSCLANNTTALFTTANSVYLGTNGISLGTGFKVTTEGNVYAGNGLVVEQVSSNGAGLELYGNPPYIDFHAKNYEDSGTDYTIRFIQTGFNYLSILGGNNTSYIQVFIEGELGVDTDLEVMNHTYPHNDIQFVDSGNIYDTSSHPVVWSYNTHQPYLYWTGSNLQFIIDKTNVGTLSDSRLKTEVSNVNENLINIANEIELKQFKLDNKNGKISIGIIAQELIALFEKYGLDINDYNFIDKAQYKMDDETLYYIVNYDQFNILYQILLKTKITNLENKVEEQEKTINSLIERIEKLEEN